MSFFSAPGIPHRSRPGRVTFSGNILAITDKETSSRDRVQLEENGGGRGSCEGQDFPNRDPYNGEIIPI